MNSPNSINIFENCNISENNSTSGTMIFSFTKVNIYNSTMINNLAKIITHGALLVNSEVLIEKSIITYTFENFVEFGSTVVAGFFSI